MAGSIMALCRSALHSLKKDRDRAKGRHEQTIGFNKLGFETHGAEKHGSQAHFKQKNSQFAPGDIFLKHAFDGDPISKVIRKGQQATGQGSAHIVHAGLMGSTMGLVEMDKNGIQMNSVVSMNEDYTYDVYRCNYPEVAARASERAVEMFEHLKSNISYSKIGAAGSLVRKAGFNSKNCQYIINNISNGGDEAFFCSGHVVLCYHAAMNGMQMAQNIFPIQHAGNLFSMSHSCYNPSVLCQTLFRSDHFKYQGTFKRGIKLG